MFIAKTFLRSFLLIVWITAAASSVYAQSSSKKIIYYASLSDPKTFYAKAGKDKSGADLVPVYFDEIKKNKGRVVDFYYITLSSDKKYFDMYAVYKGDKTDKKFTDALFYADPMYPGDLTPVKKKDHMGMDYAAVYLN